MEISDWKFHRKFFIPVFLPAHSSYFNSFKKLPLHGKIFLELGAGNGLISIYAAKKGAKVTATDINPVAVEFLRDQ